MGHIYTAIAALFGLMFIIMLVVFAVYCDPVVVVPSFVGMWVGALLALGVIAFIYD